MSNIFQDILKNTRSTPVPSLPKAVPQTKPFADNTPVGYVSNFIGSLPNSAANVFKDILQGTARSVATVGTTLGNLPTQISNKVSSTKILPPALREPNQPLPFEHQIPTDNNPFTKILFGGKPIRDLPNAGQNAVDEANQIISAVKGKEVKPISSKLAIPFGIAGSLLDLSGFGGKSAVKSFTDEIPEQFLKYVAKEQNPQAIESTLKGIGLDEVNSKALSEKLAPTKTVDEVKNTLIDFSNKSETQTKNPFAEILKSPEASTYGINGGDIGFTSRAERSRQSGIDSYMAADQKLRDYVSPNPPTPPVSRETTTVSPIQNRADVLNPDTKTQSILPTSDRANAITGIEPTPEAKITPVDRLIAEGKIRVVSRNNTDIYQVKKGGEWVNTRDEDSAVKQVSPKLKTETKLPDTLEKKKTELDIRMEMLNQDPASGLSKYYDPKIGGIPEPEPSARQKGNPNLPISKWKKEGDQISYGLGYKSSEEARYAFDKWMQDKKSLREEIKQFNIQKRETLKKPVEIKPTISSVVEPKNTPQIETDTGEGRSLEITAEQALQKVDETVRDQIPSLPKIIQQAGTNVKQKINVIDYLRTPDRVLNKIGFGEEAKALRNGYESYVKELPKNIDKITNWSKGISSDGNKRIFQFLDGQPVDLAPHEKTVALEIKDWLKEWAQRLGLPEDNTIAHYITHIFDKELISKEFDEDLAKIIADKIPGQVYDPFLLRRLGAKGYKQDTWAALDAYVKRATRKIHMDPALEKIQNKAGGSLEYSNIETSQWKYLQHYINNVNMRPTDLDNLIDNSIKSIVGYKYGQRPVTYLTKLLRQMTFRGALGLNLGSALRNISQGVNTYAVLGEKYTVLGYAKLFSPGSMAELKAEGVLDQVFIQDRTLSSTRKEMEKIDKGLFVFFDTAEKINRGSAYFGAKAKALSKGKTEEEAIDYAKEIVRKTQFAFGSIDTPVALASDIVKTLSQFQTYSIKQTEFLAEMAKDKNFIGLLRYAVAGLVFVYTIGEAFGMKPKELIPSFRFDTPTSLKLPVEATKAILNTPDKYGQPRDLKTKVSDVLKSGITLIPAGTQIKKTLEGIKAINEGGSYTKDNKLQFSQDTSKSGKAQSLLFGKYASQEAQDYFNKQEIKNKELNKIKPVYDEIQSQINDGDTASAQEIIDGLTDDEYALYKQYKKAETTKATLQGKKDIVPKYEEIQGLIQTDPEKAQQELDALTDDEYKYYELVKKQVEKDKKANAGTMPKYADEETQTNQSLIHTVATYAHAIGANPLVAFNRIFTGQKIRRVNGSAIIVERMSLADSEKVKKERGSTGSMKLDHTVPLELGGSNSEDNLSLVPEEIWNSYTPVENYLGKALQNKKISSKEAQKLIKQFKNGEISADDVYNYK